MASVSWLRSYPMVLWLHLAPAAALLAPPAWKGLAPEWEVRGHSRDIGRTEAGHAGKARSKRWGGRSWHDTFSQGALRDQGLKAIGLRLAQWRMCSREAHQTQVGGLGRRSAAEVMWAQLRWGKKVEKGSAGRMPHVNRPRWEGGKQATTRRAVHQCTGAEAGPRRERPLAEAEGSAVQPGSWDKSWITHQGTWALNPAKLHFLYSYKGYSHVTHASLVGSL